MKEQIKFSDEHLIVMAVFGIGYVIWYTAQLIRTRHEVRDDRDSVTILMHYVGGTFGVACFGPPLLMAGVLLYIPVKIIDLIRGRFTWSIEL